jgi:transcriptional regulator with XRE-family HTH domain
MEQFGETFGVSAQTVSMWERGMRSPDGYREAALRKFMERLDEAERKKELDEFLRLVVGGATAFGIFWLLTQLFDE